MESSPSDRPAETSALEGDAPDESTSAESGQEPDSQNSSPAESESPPEKRSRLPLLLFLLTVLSLTTFYVYRYSGGRPDPAKALIEAKAALQEKDWKRFESAMEVLFNHPPSQRQYYLLVGKALAARGEPERAFAAWEYCRGEGGAIEIEAFCEAANLLMKHGEQIGAVQTLRQAIDINDEVLLPHQLLVQIYSSWGARGLEQQEAEKWAELAPDDFTPHAWLAQQAYDLDDYQRAIEYYRAALERTVPSEIETHLKSRVASCLVKLLKPDEAEKILDEIAEKKEGGAERVLTLAEIRLLQGEDAVALDLVDRLSEELDKDEQRELVTDALNLKLRILQAQTRPERALETAKQLIDLDSLNYSAYLQLGQIYRRLGKTEEAEAAGREGERLRNLRLHFAELHEKAAEHVVDPAPRYELARTALELKRPDLAQMWMEAARALDPKGLERPSDLKLPAVPDETATQRPQVPSGSPLNLEFEMPKSKK
jgi:tetratricopeptide (TPR) repeat protein